MPKNRIKLLLNLLVIANQTIPRGGTLAIDPVGEGERMGFRIVKSSGKGYFLPAYVPPPKKDGEE